MDEREQLKAKATTRTEEIAMQFKNTVLNELAPEQIKECFQTAWGAIVTHFSVQAQSAAESYNVAKNNLETLTEQPQDGR